MGSKQRGKEIGEGNVYSSIYIAKNTWVTSVCSRNATK